MVADDATLKRAILLFDELHFIDRPSFTFGKFGTVAITSPLRNYEKSFRENGVPLYVHSPRDGPVLGEFLEQVQSDVNDLEFLRRFQKGLEKSLVFRNHQVPPGNYSDGLNQDEVVRRVSSVDLNIVLGQYSKPMDLFADDRVDHFSHRNEQECAKSLVTQALACSAMINFAINVSQHEGIIPLADASPYQDLLGAKYARAAHALENSGSKIQLIDLSFTIFDELVPAGLLEQLTFKDVIDYRKETETAREAFLEHLAVLQVKQGAVDEKSDYRSTINEIMVADIIPAAREFRNRLDSIYEKLFGNLTVGALSYLAGSAGLHIFGDVSWVNLLHLAGLAGAAMAKAGIEAKQAVRAARRECAVSYLLGLDK